MNKKFKWALIISAVSISGLALGAVYFMLLQLKPSKAKLLSDSEQALRDLAAMDRELNLPDF